MLLLIIILYISSQISNVYKHTSSVGNTQNGLDNLRHYDHYTINILNELVHITLLHTIHIVYVLNETMHVNHST